MQRYPTIEAARTGSGEAVRGAGDPGLGTRRDLVPQPRRQSILGRGTLERPSERSADSQPDLNDALFAMVRIASALSRTEMAFVTLLDAAKEDLRVVASSGVSPPILGTRLAVPGSLSGQVLVLGRSVRTADLLRDRRSFIRKLDQRSGTRAILAVPVWSRGKVVGTLVVASRTPQRFSARCEALLIDVARSVSFALQSQELGWQRAGGDAEEAGRSPNVEEVRSSAHSSDGGSLSDRRSPSAGLFTRRQREIVRLLVGGASCKLIAATLDMSPRTVEHHIERLKIRFRQPTLHGLVSRIVSLKVGDL